MLKKRKVNDRNRPMFSSVRKRIDDIKFSIAPTVYLNNLLKRKDLIRDSTKIAIYKNLAILYREEGDIKSETNAHSKLGELYEKVAIKLEKKGEPNLAAYKYEEAERAYHYSAKWGDENKKNLKDKADEMHSARERTRWENRSNSDSKRLEKSLIIFGGLFLGLFFLSPVVTGNAIASLTNQTSNIIGGSLFVIGIIGSYFWFKKR